MVYHPQLSQTAMGLESLSSLKDISITKVDGEELDENLREYQEYLLDLIQSLRQAGEESQTEIPPVALSANEFREGVMDVCSALGNSYMLLYGLCTHTIAPIYNLNDIAEIDKAKRRLVEFEKGVLGNRQTPEKWHALMFRWLRGGTFRRRHA